MTCHCIFTEKVFIHHSRALYLDVPQGKRQSIAAMLADINDLLSSMALLNFMACHRSFLLLAVSDDKALH